MKTKLLLLLLFCVGLMNGQDQLSLSYHLPQNITYNKAIPTPASVVGHDVGEWHITHDKLVEYMKAIAASSDRVTLENRGTTFEGRPLILLTITSPENHKNIDNIKTEHVKLTEVSVSGSLNTANMPLVVYQGFSIHGNEPSGANASLLLAYYLAAAEGNEIEELLKNTVILLDPSLNPDGLQRFAYWANTNKSIQVNPDANDREYNEVWPGGRTNHYWFDMNRDWLPVQLPESRARIETFTSWRPNILTDHHEMGSDATFFFQPGIQSRVHPLTPAANQELTKEIGNYHAKALDQIGSLYFTEENYDDFYYGKGSTYPDVNGAIGILFEQGSSRGHAQETDNGVLTFPFTIRNQFTASLSTLAAARDMRQKLLDYQRQFYVDVAKEASKSAVKAIVFGDEKDRTKAYRLAEILTRHKVEIHEITSDFNYNGKKYAKEGSYIVPTNQKNFKLIQAMFEKRTTFTDSLFYDISAWTFPLAFNLNYAELKSTAQVGAKIENLKKPEGKLDGKNGYAFLMEWHEYNTPKVLNKILNQGIRAKVGMRPFHIEGKSYDYGTILIPVQNQNMSAEELGQFLESLALESGVTITGVQTGLTTGIDLGSSQFRIIQPQKVALFVGDGVASHDAGEIWHLFDTRYDMKITKLDTRDLNRNNIDKYTSIIIPSANPDLSKETVEKLQRWTSNGGVLIGYKNAVRWLNSNNFISLEFDSVTVPAKDVTFEQVRDFNGAQVIGGAIFETKIDRSHPINFGYTTSTLPLFRRTSIFIKPDEKSYNNPIQYTNSPLLSGYISNPNLEVLRNKVPFQVKRKGSGRVVVFTDNTNFRAFWYGTNKLMMNAIFFGNHM